MIPKSSLTEEAKNQLNKIKEIEITVDRAIIKRINIHLISAFSNNKHFW